MDTNKDKFSYVLIFFITILLIGIGSIMILFNPNNELGLKKNKTEKSSATNETSISATLSSTSHVKDETTTSEIISTNPSITYPSTSVSANSTKSTRTTTKTSTTKASTSASQTKPSVIPDNNYTIVVNPILYPSSLLNWEEHILKSINDERKKLGYNSLNIAKELQDKAHEAALYWYGHTDRELEDYLSGYRIFSWQSNLLDSKTGYEKLTTVTLNKTNIAKGKYYEYVGIAVVYLEKGFNNIPTHYYVIIYE